MYFKIACQNVKKSLKDFTIYFLTIMIGVCLFYSFNSIHSQQAVLAINNSQREMMDLMQSMINGISVFVAVILGFLVIYANQFLMKRRYKEMAIYLVLGMEKRKVSKILVIETMIIGIAALAIGLILGVFLSQGLAVVTAKMFAVQMKEFHFIFSSKAFVQTIMYFIVIFLVVMVFHGFTISRYKLIDLLNASKKNQKLKVRRLWLSVVLFIISIVTLGAAYKLIMDNGMTEADNTFYASIILGIIGTFLFFLSLSGLLLRIAKSRKSFYYKNLHMFVLRQINAKITTTFVAMTFLCLMMFLAISAFGTGAGMASAVKGDLKRNTPYSYSFYDYQTDETERRDINYIENGLKKDGIELRKYAKEVHPIFVYKLKSDNGKYISLSTFAKGREKYSSIVTNMLKTHDINVSVLKLSDYNQVLKDTGKKPIKLKKNQYLINSNYTNIKKIMDAAVREQQSINIDGKQFKPYKEAMNISYMNAATSTDPGTIVLEDELIEKLQPVPVQSFVNLNWNEKMNSKKFDALIQKTYGDDDEGKSYSMTLSKEEVYEQSSGLKMVVTYVAIYIGAVFLITCAAVLALQQLSENADNLSKYQMLTKIGVDRKMILGTVKAQILLYFMVPLSLACVHAYVGIKTASEVIAVLGSINIVGAAIQTIGIIFIIYGGYMMATYVGSKGMLKRENI